jgi:glycosyltransferase involved in cell wall biosynthesis
MTTRDVAVHQVLATLGYGDAIGNEVLGIQRILQDAGYVSRIYVETVDPRLEDRTQDYRSLIEDSHPDNILIHHFSLGSRASRVAFALPDRMILVYHNITPPRFFLDVRSPIVEQCFSGRRELGAYARRCDLALGDSEFNRSELDALGFPRTDVLPVVPDFGHLDVTPHRWLARQFDDQATNILFVGRIIPNKRIEDLIRFFDVYRRRYNRSTRLLLVGSHALFDNYRAALAELIQRLGTPDVHLIGHVSNEELTSLYDVADLFLSASEHEGFCVPLIEAFYKRIPVIAFAAAAVPATMDGGGVLYERKDPRHVASLINAVATDTALEDEILEAQDAALARLQAKDFAGTLLGFVERVRTAPHLPPWRIAEDFWSQHERTERLEELHMFRPSAFQALPSRADRRRGPAPADRAVPDATT